MSEATDIQTETGEETVRCTGLVRPLCACGSRTFYVSYEVRGVWNSTITWPEEGSPKEEGDGDSLRNVRDPKTMRCADCGKRRPYVCPRYDRE